MSVTRLPVRRALILLLTVKIGFGLLCSCVLADQAQATGTNAPNFSAVEAKISSWIERGYFPGAVLIVVKDDRVLIEHSYGSYTPETQVYIASAGKWLASATIAAVVDEGKLSWDDPVAKWLPKLRDSKGRATLRQLLSHTAGYPDYQPKGRRRDDYQTLAESVAAIVILPAADEPGARFRYGGLALQVAGRMAELATGQDWETIFQTRIAQPLGLTGTVFTPVDGVIEGHSPMLGGGARSTSRDYIRFLEMIAGDGMFRGRRILSQESIREMQADQVRGAHVEPGAEFVEMTRGAKHHGIYGLGEWREKLDGHGNAVLLSSPSWAGAYPWFDKDRRLYGVFLAHVDVSPGNAAVRDKFNAFYSSPVLATLVADAVDERVGSYRGESR